MRPSLSRSPARLSSTSALGALALCVFSGVAHAASLVSAPRVPGPTEQAPAAGMGVLTGSLWLDAAAAGDASKPLATLSVLESGESFELLAAGPFRFELPPGQYTLDVTAVGQSPRLIDGVGIDAGLVTFLELDFRPKALGEDAAPETSIEEVVVTTKPDKSTAAVQLVVRQRAVAMTDAVSAEQIARTPDSSAGDAVKRVVSATIQDGKYVVVRGLGGRYNATLLNGVPLPSPDPDANAAPLDLFPALLLSSLTVSKTSSPELPGSFAGGVLLIETREFPAEPVLKLRLSLAGDDLTTLRDVHAYDGGAWDWAGFDDGTRALPDEIPTDGPLAARDDYSQAQADAAARAFSDTWALETRKALPNAGLTATAGDTRSLAGKKLGWLASAAFGRKEQRRYARLARTDASGEQEVEVMHQETGLESAQVGGLINTGLELAPDQRLTLVALYTHSADDQASRRTGTPEGQAEGNLVERTQLRFIERALAFAQLVGEHAVTANTRASWQTNVSRTTQDEPDTRELTYTTTPGSEPTIALSGAGSADRFFAQLEDLGAGAGVKLEHDLGFSKLVGGGSIQSTLSREFGSRRFRYTLRDTSLATLPAEQLLADTHLGEDVRVDEVTRFTDAYEAARHIIAGHLAADTELFEALRVVAGARYERSAQTLTYGTRFSGTTSGDELTRTDGDVMPSVSAIWKWTDATQFRAAASLSVARANFRELSPALFFDFARGRVVSGNPNLVNTRIQNYDLRAEHYLGATELVAASLFAKRFRDPIEAVFKDQNGDAVTYVNTPRAQSVGLELEARTSFAHLSRALAFLSASVNMSFIHSRIDLDDDDGDGTSTIEGTSRARALQGQAPYVINAELAAKLESTGTDATLLYNVVGRRLAEVGVAGTPDAYEQPFHRVDLTVAQSLGESLRLKLAATNLANQSVVFRRAAIDLLRFRPGVAASASLEWTL